MKTFTDARLAFVVPPDAFDPRPKVWSALVVMEVLAKPRLAEPDAVFRLAERVFQFRRKQLGASLRRVTGAAAEDVVARLNEAGVEPSQRPQELSVAEWARVHRAFAG